MKSDEKSSPLILLKILQERTDEDTCLSTKELLEILREEYGIDMHRVTLKKDIELLMSLNFGIFETRKRENVYNYVDREFDTAELKLLVDAVASSHLISEGDTNNLIGKLTALAAKPKAAELTRNIVYSGKQDSKNVFYTVDAVNEAINLRKKIRYRMSEYNEKGRKVLRNKGEAYVFSPWSLVWDNDNYYMVGFSEKYRSIGNVRIDRIWELPEILGEDAEPMPRTFRIGDYLKEHYRMQTADWETVTLQCSNEVMGAIRDRFGDIKILPHDKSSFFIRERISVGSVFFSWVFGFGGKVRIHSPESVRDQYRAMAERAMKEE